MLSKLLRYDFTSMLRTFVPMWVLILITSLFSRLVFTTGFQTSGNISFATDSLTTMVYAISNLLLMALFIGTYVLCIVLIIQRFYRGLLGDEGYLMFTLPVKSWQLVLSKLISATSIVILSALVACAVALLYYASYLQDLSALIRDAFSLDASFYYVLLLICGLLFITSSITQVYFSMAVGHLFRKHRIATAVIAYIILNTVTSYTVGVWIETIPLEAWMSVASEQGNYGFAIYSVVVHTILINGIKTVLFFVGTVFILDKRLNLE